MNRRNSWDDEVSRLKRQARFWGWVVIVCWFIVVIAGCVYLVIEMWPYLNRGK